MTSKLDHALQLAQQGFYVFPCDTETNTPILPWRERSTRNPATIRDWFICPFLGFEQDYNIGVDCCKSGVTVIDVDVKNGKQGRVWYEKWQTDYGWSATRMQTTASGGLHLIYKAQGFKNSVEKLAPGIDVRSDGGFYIAAGSTKNGKTYILEHDIEPKPLPNWLEEKLTAIGKATSPTARDSGKTIIADNPDDIEAAIYFLQNHPPAIEGEGGDIHTYKTFCQLKERGVAIQTAIDLAAEHWNPNCEPPWGHDDLIAKANSAYKSAQNATGAKSPLAEFDTPKDAPKAYAEPKQPRFNPGFELPDACTIKPRDWVFGGMALAKQVSMLVAMPGVGKSTFTLSMALSKVTGRNLLAIDPFARGAVALFNNEDNMDEQTRRLVAAAQCFKIKKSDLYRSEHDRNSMLFINGRDHPLKIAKRIANNAIKAVDADPMVDYALENDIRLMIVDPFSMTHPATENSNEEIIKVGTLFNYVAEKTNAAIVLVHHTRKNQMASAQGHSGNLDSARGASALGGLVRVAYTLDSLSAQEAKHVGVSEDHRRNYVLLEQAKANMSAPGIDRRYYLRHGEVIGTPEHNESVGVLTPVNLNSMNAANEATRTLLEHLEELLKDGEQSVSAIAKLLPDTHYAYYAEKHPRAIAQAIHRLFREEKTITGLTGHIHAEDRPNGKANPLRYLSFKLFTPLPARDTPDLSDLI